MATEKIDIARAVANDIRTDLIERGFIDSWNDDLEQFFRSSVTDRIFNLIENTERETHEKIKSHLMEVMR